MRKLKPRKLKCNRFKPNFKRRRLIANVIKPFLCKKTIRLGCLRLSLVIKPLLVFQLKLISHCLNLPSKVAHKDRSVVVKLLWQRRIQKSLWLNQLRNVNPFCFQMKKHHPKIKKLSLQYHSQFSWVNLSVCNNLSNSKIQCLMHHPMHPFYHLR